MLSQCGTIISMRLNNDRDQAFVKAAMPEGARGFLDSIPALRNRECIICGEGVAIPIRVAFDNLEECQAPGVGRPELQRAVDASAAAKRKRSTAPSSAGARRASNPSQRLLLAYRSGTMRPAGEPSACDCSIASSPDSASARLRQRQVTVGRPTERQPAAAPTGNDHQIASGLERAVGQEIEAEAHRVERDRQTTSGTHTAPPARIVAE